MTPLAARSREAATMSNTVLGHYLTMPLGSLTRRSVSKAAGIHSGLSRHQLKFQ